MDIKRLQDNIRQSTAEMKMAFRSGAEIVLALVEELGEAATEVALIEQIGSKAEWEKPPSTERLATELSDPTSHFGKESVHASLALSNALHP